MLFKRNHDAHKCLKFGTRANAFAAKDKYLRAAISLARKINLSFFNWGIELDPECINYEIVIYFQIGKEQLSFHTNYIAPSPKFDGQWIGYGQNKFPFSLPKVRQLLKESSFPLNNLTKKEAIIPEKKVELYDIMEEVRSIRDAFREEFNYDEDEENFWW